MNPQLLLEKIIEKAVKNGWKYSENSNEYLLNEIGAGEVGIDGLAWEIFSHSFAKAYFGEKYICTSCNKESGEDFFEHERQTNCNADYEAWYTLSAWRVHIQALALTPPEERLSYLAKYL